MGAPVALHREPEVEEPGRSAAHTARRIARDRRNLIVRGFAALAPPDAFEFTIRSDIPLSGGLGTSAAAIVAARTAPHPAFWLWPALLPPATPIVSQPANGAAQRLGGIVGFAG